MQQPLVNMVQQQQILYVIGKICATKTTVIKLVSDTWQFGSLLVVSFGEYVADTLS